MQEVNSYYAHSAGPQAAFASLLGDQRADICIVGAGYTGLSSALHLAERGYSVIVLEAESVGFGASGRNGGHVGIGQRQDQYYLEKQFGDEVARGLWDMGLEAVDTVEQLIQKHGIHCDLKRGILHLAHRSKYCRELEDEVDHLRDHYQFEQMEYVDAGALPNFLDSQAYYGAQWDKASLHLHPLKYAQGLGKAAAEAGVTICEQSKVLSYSEGDSIVVRTANGSVTASELVLACNGYIEKLEPRINGYIMPINNFILATEPLSNDLAQSVSVLDTAMQELWKFEKDKETAGSSSSSFFSMFTSPTKQQKGASNAREKELNKRCESLNQRLGQQNASNEATREAQRIVLETKESVVKSLLKQNAQLTSERDILATRAEDLTATVEQLTSLLRGVQSRRQSQSSSGSGVKSVRRPSINGGGGGAGKVIRGGGGPSATPTVAETSSTP